jgi:tetratricopeptide (TPR) repeat protein
MRCLNPVGRLSLIVVFPLALSVGMMQAQQKGGGASNPSGGASTPSGGNTGGGLNTPGSFPGSNRNTTTNSPNSGIYSPTNPDATRPIFLAGRVLMDDGSKPPIEVTIQRVCNGNPHTEAHVDSKGHFSFQLGANPMSMMDASESSTYDQSPRNPGQQNSVWGQPGSGMGGRGITQRDLMGCQIQASYPGYRSDTVDLSMRRSLDNPDVGVLVLHRLGGVHGTAISMTTELAPKKARKSYEKAMQLVQKGKLDEAEGHLQEAVAEYPKYAVAWFELGAIQASNKEADGARKSFEAAIAADPKYVNPYDGLARLDASQGKWQETADRSKQAVYLNPVEYPTSWFYNALANYNLKNFEAAEKSAKEVLKLDGAHRLAQVETLMAQLCADKADYAGAAQHLQAYLALRPNDPNGPVLKQQLAKLQETIAQTKK